MNWFQKLWNNPNLHIIAGIASGAASVAFPAYADPLRIVAGAFGGAGLLLPEQPNQAVLKDKPVAPIVNLPPAAGGGSYHAIDYANLAAALVQQLAPKDKAGRS